MSFIQFLIIVFALFVISRIILSFKKREISLKIMLFWLGIWLAISVAVSLPQTIGLFAKILGVRRDIDAAIYLSIALIFYLIFRLFVKLEKTESDITTIVREISLRNKEK